MQEPSSLLAALRNALLLGAALLVAPVFAAGDPPAKKQGSAVTQKAAKAKPKAKPTAKTAAKADGKQAAKKPGKKGDATKAAKAQKPGPLADFGQEDPPAEVAHVANWVSVTRNNQKRSFVLIDKKNANLYVFAPTGKLRSKTPVLLGKAVGDHSAPGIGNKPLSQIKEEEKTTPAGRFFARPGKNNHGEDIIWIDYNAAVSMHRLRKVSAEERRADRLASAESDDNRISNGCVNVPPSFYNKVLRPAVGKTGAYVYVLPETTTPQRLFGSFDVQATQLAQATTGTGSQVTR